MLENSLPEPTLPLNTDFGPYHLQKLIAVGGMAEIYLSRTKGVAGFEKLLALKVIHPDYADDDRFVQMLIDEARLAVKLNHPNIAQTFDLGAIEDVYFISMEYVDGPDYFKLLRAVTDRDEHLPIDAALYIAHQVCMGLEYAHNKLDDDGKPLKIIHRDISPQNILLSRHGEVKLVDFGIAKAANVSRKTRAGVIKGKLVYMSPEQSWGEDIDQRADVYSAGIVLYEALTSGSLYLEQNPVKLLKLVRKPEIQPPSSRRSKLPPDVDDLVMKALTAKPAERYQTAREFADAIKEFLSRHGSSYGATQLGTLVSAVLDGGPIPNEDTIPSQPPRRRVRSRPLVQSMSREDYAAHGHSVIFSAEEMLSAGLPGVRQRRPTVTNSPHAGRPPPPPSAQVAAAAAPQMASSTLGTQPRSAPADSDQPPARLVLLGEGGAESHPIGKQFIIGRSGDLRLSNNRVSRRHARIVYHEGRYLLEDLNSSNGTFLNETKVAQITPLKAEDVIRIGPFQMQFVVEAPPSLLDQSRRPRPPAWLSNITPSPELSALPPTIPPGEPQELDKTARRHSAYLSADLDGEKLVIPVDRPLPLDFTLAAGELQIPARAGRVAREGDACWLRPAGRDRTPVLLNGQPLDKPAQLKSGDVVKVGPLTLQFEE